MKNLFANCGGTNLRSDRFAGTLLKDNLSEELFAGIMHSLIFPGGVRKTTAYGRNVGILEYLLAEGQIEFPKHSLSVLDMGASGGLDAISTYQFLSRKTKVEHYTLGDLYTHVSYDPKRGLIFDQDGNLIQIKRRFGFVSTNFECNTYVRKLLSWPKRLRPWLLERRYRRFSDSTDLIEIPLVHPDSKFSMKRMDVFEPIQESFDFVICMHLLIERYFLKSKIEDGIKNLQAILNPGGYLLVGASDDYRLFHKNLSGFVSEKEL